VPFYDEFYVNMNSEPGDKNIILVVLEGIQYEQTSLSGNTGDLTPFLANFAESGVKFTNARSTLTHTTKALFSILTGRYASASQDLVEAIPMDKPYASLVTILRDELGYRTAFFQSATGDFECRPGLVYNLGFDEFITRDDLDDPNMFVGYLGCDEFAMIKPVTQWLERNERPFFITFLCSVTHDPYETPEWYGERPKEDIDRYRQTIAYTDKFLSTLDTELTSAGFMDNTILCIVGDHGEAFGEHGRSGHERIAFDEGLHIPFCIRAPSIIEPGTVISSSVGSIDLTPTLLGLLGFETEGFDGLNALVSFNDNRKLYFSGWMYESEVGFVQGNIKYIYDPLHQIICFYDLQADPYELQRHEVEENIKQKLVDDIESWRENTIFKFDQQYKGQKIIYNQWFCKWGNRKTSAKFVLNEQEQEFSNK
jgi:phosphoglycerol transferase MdoB-like AlkP superfamily enzyme